MATKFLIHKKCSNSSIVCVCVRAHARACACVRVKIIQKNICQDATLCALLAMSSVKIMFHILPGDNPTQKKYSVMVWYQVTMVATVWIHCIQSNSLELEVDVSLESYTWANSWCVITVLHLSKQLMCHYSLTPEQTVDVSLQSCTWANSWCVITVLHLSKQLMCHYSLTPEQTVDVSLQSYTWANSWCVITVLHLSKQLCIKESTFWSVKNKWRINNPCELTSSYTINFYLLVCAPVPTYILRRLHVWPCTHRQSDQYVNQIDNPKLQLQLNCFLFCIWHILALLNY